MKYNFKKRYTLLLLGGILLVILSSYLKIDPTISDFFNSLEGLFNLSYNILTDSLYSIGFSLIMAYITARFVISNELNKLLNLESKRNITAELIKDDELFEYKIEKLNSIFNFDADEYRDNVKYNVTVTIKDGNVVVTTVASYTVHPLNQKGFAPLKLRFDNKNIEIDDVTFSNPSDCNDFESTPNLDDIEWKEQRAYKDGLYYEKDIPVPDRFKKFKSLIISKEYTSTEFDHWGRQGLIFDHVTHGVDFFLKIENDDLVIKEVIIMEKIDLYKMEQKEKSVTIKSTQWLSRNSGFYILIAKRN